MSRFRVQARLRSSWRSSRRTLFKGPLNSRGTAEAQFKVAGRYFVPWTSKPANEPLSIEVSYDRTRLAQDEIATATAVVRNNLNKTANMRRRPFYTSIRSPRAIP
jgi:hypothetical protein